MSTSPRDSLDLLAVSLKNALLAWSVSVVEQPCLDMFPAVLKVFHFQMMD